ncbi:aldo/keto reductase, partial [Georgenia sp.]
GRVLEAAVVPASRELGLSQIVFSPVAQGVLTGKYAPGTQVPGGSRAADKKGGDRFIRRLVDDEELLRRVQLLRPVAEQLDLTMAQLAVAWVLQHDNVAAAIIGASRPEQVAENVQAAGVDVPDELMGRIDEILGDKVVRDPALTSQRAPHSRPS